MDVHQDILAVEATRETQGLAGNRKVERVLQHSCWTGLTSPAVVTAELPASLDSSWITSDPSPWPQK